MIKNNKITPKPIILSKAVYQYGYCPNDECRAEVYPDDKFCRKCGLSLLSPTAASIPEPEMIYFQGQVWGTEDQWVYGAHFYDGHRNYIITAIPGTNLVLRGHRSDNVALYAVNPGSVAIVQPSDLCPICGKPIFKAQWFDIAKQDGKNVPIKTVVEWHPSSETYDLTGLLKIFESLYSFNPERFTRKDMEEVEIFEDDMGAHCLTCGATL